MAKVQFKSSNIKKFANKWKGKGKRLADLTPAHKEVSIYLDQWVLRNFKVEGAALSDGKWKPFALGGRYVKGKGIDHSARLLQKSGDLRRSFLPFANKKTAGIGSDLPYAAAHNDGKGAPKRRILPFQKEVKNKIDTILTDYGKEVLESD